MKVVDGDYVRDEILFGEAYVSDELAAYIKRVFDEAPTIEAEPVKHGRWETDAEDIEWGNSLKRKYCTNCKKRPHFDKESRKFILTDYCHNCGAKMDLKEEK